MVQFLNTWFDTIWSLFSINWPGFQFTIGQVLIAVAVAVFGLSVLSRIGGFSISVGGIVNSALSLEGKKALNSKRIKISEKRKGDRF